MKESALVTAHNDAAPADERAQANVELQKSTMPRGLGDLLPGADVREAINWISNQYEEQQLAKALSKPNVIPFPSKAVKNHEAGMQSVWIDDMQVSTMGDYYEKPSAFGFDAARSMVDQTPILSAIIMTRQRQVQRFCRPPSSVRGPGFQVQTKDVNQEVGADQKGSIQALQDFFLNCGRENRPRQRQRLKRDDFSSFMAKLTRDTLTMDSMPIETEFKRNRNLGLDGMYAVDGATIRLCTEDGYEGDDEIFALQVVQGRIRSAYTYNDLIYVPRNPCTSIVVGGYGVSETELLVRVVTGFLNAFSYNTKFFDSNAIPKGMLHLSGNYDERDMNAFKRYWNAMVKGINNSWALPVMVSKDQESSAKFEKFGVDVDDVMFAKWMTFLTSIICALYSIAPDEINFESFSAGTSSLSGSDTDEKITNSKDKGLRPLLTYYENLFSDYIVQEFSPDYVFRFTGLDPEDDKARQEMRKLVLTVDEIRAQESYDPWPVKGSKMGDAPVNPALLGVWQMEQGMAPQPGDEGGDQPGAAGGDATGGKATGKKNPKPKAAPAKQVKPAKAPKSGETSDTDTDNVDDANEQEGADDMTKSFGLPIFTIDP
jgi:hypothetical protein